MNSKTLAEIASSPALFRDHLLVDTDNGPKPLAKVMDPWQRDDFLALDDAWRTVARRGTPANDCKMRSYRERARGHSKTLDAAVMVAWVLFATKRMISGVAAAADRDQAKLLRDAVAKLLQINPWLANFLEAQTFRVVNKQTGSELTILSSDSDSSYGLTPEFIIVDELTHWGVSGEALWISLFSAAAKRATCLLCITSNAGVGEGSSWQWHVREAARTDDAWHFSRLDGPQASWISPKHLAEQRRMLPAIAYDRLWLNKWTTGQGDALTEADIARAIDADRGPLAKHDFAGAKFLAGLDLGIKRDCSALVIGGVEYSGHRVRVAKIEAWQPSAGEQVDLTKVEQTIIDLHREYGFTLFYDPWQAQHMAQRLQARGIACVEVPSSGPNMTKMASAVVETFSEGQIELYDDAELLADLRSLRIVEKSYGYRIDAQRTKAGHADRAFATALLLYGVRETCNLGMRPGFLEANPADLPDVRAMLAKVQPERSKPIPWHLRDDDDEPLGMSRTFTRVY